MAFRGKRLVRFLTLSALIALGTTAASGLTGAQKCESAKLKEAGKYAACLLKAEAKAAKKGSTPDYGKCDAKFASKWQKAEGVAGEGVCPSEGDQAAMELFLVEMKDQIAAALAGGPPPQCPAVPLQTGQILCDQGAGSLGTCPGEPDGQDAWLMFGDGRHYTDNGDGTITDEATLLTWEKLSDDGSIHDKDNTYSWYAAFETKIAMLNSQNFAGHSDWRLPNRFELETLIDLGRVNPAIDPAFNTACGAGCDVVTCSCTRSTNFATSTSYQNDPAKTWYVSFFDGNAFSGSKTGSYWVRAVRGGS